MDEASRRRRVRLNQLVCQSDVLIHRSEEVIDRMGIDSAILKFRLKQSKETVANCMLITKGKGASSEPVDSMFLPDIDVTMPSED